MSVVQGDVCLSIPHGRAGSKGVVERVLQHPRGKKYLKRSPGKVGALIERFRRAVTAAEPGVALAVIEEDPADSCALECAVSGGASYIVSGNDHLLKIKKYREIVILSPTGFLILPDLR